MKRILFLSALILATGIVTAQTTAVVSPAPSKPLSIGLTPFGFDQMITVGNLDKTGKAMLNPEIDFGKIPDSVKENHWISIGELFGFCDNFLELFSEEDGLEALEMGPMFLLQGAEVAGFITLVSDTALYEWVNDPGYGDAAPGSYFEAVYLSDNFDFKGNCTQTTNLETGDLETSFEIDVDLKAGLNYLEFKIEGIHQGSAEMASIPKKVMVTAHTVPPANAKWMARYY